MSAIHPRTSGVWRVTPLGLLNFLVLQWFGVRLARVTERRPIPGDLAGAMLKAAGLITGDQYRCRTVTVGYRWLRWVWPLTGWWSAYRWIAFRYPAAWARACRGEPRAWALRPHSIGPLAVAVGAAAYVVTSFAPWALPAFVPLLIYGGRRVEVDRLPAARQVGRYRFIAQHAAVELNTSTSQHPEHRTSC